MSKKLVATVETLSESKLCGSRRSTSTSSNPSVVKKSSSISSELGIRSRLIHNEAAEVSGGPTVIRDQQFEISDNLSIDRCSSEFERSPGANTYQFVMSNPVGNVDPEGTQVYGVHPYIPSPLVPVPGPGTNYGEVVSGVWNLGFGGFQIWAGAANGEFGGLVVSANGLFETNNGPHQILNGFGADWPNPYATSLWGALGAPKPLAHAMGAFAGRIPANAADAIDEAKNINDLPATSPAGC